MDFYIRIKEAVGRRWWTLVSKFFFLVSKVESGRDCLVYGFPLISVSKNGAVELGDRVVMCSSSTYTALGVSRKIIIRTVLPNAKVSIGDDTGLSGTVICSAKSILIGKRCLIGSDVKIFDTDFHAISPEGRRYKPISDAVSAPVVIEDDVFIGAGVMVLKGSHIGRGSVIAAGSVVSGIIPPMVICGGVPARVLRDI